MPSRRVLSIIIGLREQLNHKVDTYIDHTSGKRYVATPIMEGNMMPHKYLIIKGGGGTKIWYETLSCAHVGCVILM